MGKKKWMKASPIIQRDHKKGKNPTIKDDKKKRKKI